jgi:membrane protein DedA with SNARE-associated domain
MHPLLNASVTDSLVTFATHVIRDLGYAGTALLNVSSAIIAVPGTEATMLFSGFNVYQHHLTLLGIILFGVLGDIVGALIAYAIGFYGLHELLDRPGSPFHISHRRLELAHRWFDRYGAPVLLVSRLIPLLRSIFPYAAGISRVELWRFVPFTAVGSVIWIGGLGIVGKEVGSNWSSWRSHLEYVDYAVVALIVAAIAYLVVRRVRSGARAAV